MSRIYTGTWSAYGTFEIEADSKSEAEHLAHEELGDLDFGTDFKLLLTDGSEVEIEADDA